MATTKYKIAEQVLQLLKGGNPKAATSVELEDIIEYVGQCINKVYKQEVFTGFAEGETIPNGSMLTYFDNLTPIAYKGVSKLTLPVQPISLPRNAGIFHVSRTEDISDGFIPVLNGQTSLIKNERLISDVLNQVTYTPYGQDIVFNQDLTTENGISLIVGLIVMDINLLSDYDALPLSADMESDVVTATFKLFSAQLPGAKLDDPSAERVAGKN